MFKKKSLLLGLTLISSLALFQCSKEMPLPNNDIAPTLSGNGIPQFDFDNAVTTVDDDYSTPDVLVENRIAYEFGYEEGSTDYHQHLTIYENAVERLTLIFSTEITGGEAEIGIYDKNYAMINRVNIDEATGIATITSVSGNSGPHIPFFNGEIFIACMESYEDDSWILFQIFIYECAIVCAHAAMSS